MYVTTHSRLFLIQPSHLKPLKHKIQYFATASKVAAAPATLAWHELHRAAQLAHWSGLCYLPWNELQDAVAAENLELVAFGRTSYTAWFIADGRVDYGRLLQRMRHSNLSSGDVDVETLLAPPPTPKERFVFLRGVHWSAPDSDNVKMSQKLMDIWPVPFGDASAPPHAPLVAHGGAAAMAKALFPNILPHIQPPGPEPALTNSPPLEIPTPSPTTNQQPTTTIRPPPPASPQYDGSGSTTDRTAHATELESPSYSSQQSTPAPHQHPVQSSPHKPQGPDTAQSEAIPGGTGSLAAGPPTCVSASEVHTSDDSPPNGSQPSELAAGGARNGATDGPPTQITFAGHSLGGALGKLLCVLTRLNTSWASQALTCYTFGSPPVLAHRDGGGGDRALQSVGMKASQVTNFVLENDPVPRAMLTADPLLTLVKDLSAVQALLQMRGWLLGRGAALSPDRFLFENVGHVHLIEWSQEGGTEVQRLDPSELDRRLQMSMTTPGKAPMKSLQAVLDHHHGSYAQELDLAALIAARRKLK